MFITCNRKGLQKMKRLALKYLVFLCLFFALCTASNILAAPCTEPSNGDYSSTPVFMASAVTPNIMIILDNSGSMNFNAYGTYPGDGGTVSDDPFQCGKIDVTSSTSRDDAEEILSSGDNYGYSSDLDIGNLDNVGSTPTAVGVRFQNVNIPQGSTITSAYISFKAKTSEGVASSFTIYGDDTDNAELFSLSSYGSSIAEENKDISNRTKTTASVTWVPGAWVANTRYPTDDLKTIIQEIVNRGGWASGNSMAFTITGTGKRDAYPRDGGSTSAPQLHVEFGTECPDYYGYFDPDAKYTYDGNSFVWAGTTGDWDGSWLNWLCMRRVDVLRKVIMGGLATSRTGGGNQTNIGETPTQSSRVFWKVQDTCEDYTPYTGTYKFKIEGGYIKVYTNAGSYVTSYTIKVNKDSANEDRDFYQGNLAGVMQKVGEDKAYWGNMWYYYGTGNNRNGGFISNAINTNMTTLITDLQNTGCDTYTPLAETYYVCMQYFKQEAVDSSLDYANGCTGPFNNTNDPYYNNAEFVSCAKSFVILLTDGASTKDRQIPDFLKDYDGDGNDSSTYSSDGTNYLDDIALYARTNDLRSDLSGDQNMILYCVYAFGNEDNARSLLMDAARNGGFDDKNGNGKPDGDYDDPAEDREEWDADGNGVPDTYFEAQDGFQLEEELMNAITDILKRAASGTAASVLATTSQGEGNLIQAYFLPSYNEGTTELEWLGYLQSLWVDAYGNLREDTVNDYELDETEDRVMVFFQDEGSGDTKVKTYEVSADAPYPDLDNDTYTELGLDEIVPVWEAGKALAKMDASDRYIFTYLDSDEDEVVDDVDDDILNTSGEVISFTTSNAASIKPYLGVQDGGTWSHLGDSYDTRVTNVINWIRGVEVTDLRTRTRTVDDEEKVWKLGDIVHSTPVTISRPTGRYDILYGDTSYRDYYTKYKNRETVVYVGANDGMLHAITSWQYEYDGTVGVYTQPSATVESIGQEIWAYIPRTLLPQLKWLPATDYSHVYYVDLMPSVIDAKIFTADDTHPNGWGTVLVCGLNMGGREICVDADFDGNGSDEVKTFKPTYFALDVTNPRDPKLLWEKSYDYMAMSTSIPKLLKVEDKWFVTFGSGPDGYNGESTQNGYMYVVDLATGQPCNTDGSLCDGNDYLYQTSESYAYFTSPTVVDKELSTNFTHDAVYMGETYYASNTWKSKLYKLNIPCTTCDWDTGTQVYVDTPDDWLDPKVMFQTNNPIQADLAASTDKFGNLWMYFGTGRYIEEDDKTDSQQQYLFGIKDPFYNETLYGGDSPSYYHSTSTNKALDTGDLLDSDDFRISTTGVVYSGNSTYGGWNDLLTAARAEDGWMRSLSSGSPSERCITKASILGGMVFVPTYVPTDNTCGFGGDSYIYSLYYETGTAYYNETLEDDIADETIGGAVRKIVQGRQSLGSGVPAHKLGFHLGKQQGAKAFIQQSTGEVIGLDVDVALNIKSGLTTWKENSSD